MVVHKKWSMSVEHSPPIKPIICVYSEHWVILQVAKEMEARKYPYKNNFNDKRKQKGGK